MKEIIIKFSDIAAIKFIGTEELIDLVKRYYPNCEDNNAKADYIIQLNAKVLPKDIKIPNVAKLSRCFAGPHYYSWKNGQYNLAYSPPEERGGSHLVIRKDNLLQVSFHEGEPPNQIIGISREVLIKEALAKGYMPIHASAISKDNKGYIFFGNRNKGKSTSFFSSIIYNGAKPMSGDVAIVREEKDGWKVMGWAWTATIDQSFFDIINRKPIYNTPNNGKIKYYPSDFCREFNTQWIWKQPLEEIINVNLDPNSKATIKELSPKELEERLEQSGKEKWWRWNDVFGLGEKKPIYEYTGISKKVKGSVLIGDIIQFFRDRQHEKDIEI